MTIYIEMVLIENVCMNFIILFAVGKINKSKIKIIKIGIASLIGSIYSIFSVLVINNIVLNSLCKIFLSISLVYISFNSKNIKQLLKQILIFYMVTFAFGGLAFALLYFLRPADIVMKNGILIGYYPIKIIILSAIIGFLITTTSFKIIRGKLNKKNICCEVEIEFEGKSKTIKVLIDTGNMLKDPITKIPVIVIEKTELEDIITDKILKNTEEIISGKVENLEYITKLKIIPFTSLGKANGMLLGFKVDKITIIFEEEKYENINALIGIYNEKLTKNEKYFGLIGLNVLEGGKKDEYNKNNKITV